MNANEIGNFLSELRKQKGMKQNEVADAIHVSDKAISRWETGRGIPDVGSLQSLSEFYQVSINEILSGRYIMEAEMAKATDQNVKELIKQKFSLKQKLKIAIGGIVILSFLFGIAMMPIPSVAISYKVSADAIDSIFQKVEQLENAGIDYSISLDIDNKSIQIQIKDYDKYEELIHSKF